VSKKAAKTGLSPRELARQEGAELPDRQAMSLLPGLDSLGGGGILGAPADGAPAPAPDPSSDPAAPTDLGLGGSLANHADDRHATLPTTATTSTPDHATSTAGPTAPAPEPVDGGPTTQPVEPVPAQEADAS
jgi:hypothetical protein